MQIIVHFLNEEFLLLFSVRERNAMILELLVHFVENDLALIISNQIIDET